MFRTLEQRRSVRRVCEDCGTTFYNLHAHLEECTGIPKAQSTRACGARRPTGFNLYTYCIMAPGHDGPHHYLADW